MTIKYDDAPECVRRLAFAFMQYCLPRDLPELPPKFFLASIGDGDVASHVAALRWLADQAAACESEGSMIDRIMAGGAAKQYAEYAQKLEKIATTA